MKRVVLCALAVLCCACTVRTGALPQVKRIARVAFTQTSGPAPLERQWRERIVIEESRTLLVRTGPPEATDLNDGQWEVEVESRTVSMLLERPAAIDPSSIRAVPSQDYLDGGTLTTYEIQYVDSTALFLACGEGQIYGDERAVIEPIAEFIASLVLPVDAARWHDSSSNAD